jgi:hypothetical protein
LAFDSKPSLADEVNIFSFLFFAANSISFSVHPSVLHFKKFLLPFFSYKLFFNTYFFLYVYPCSFQFHLASVMFLSVCNYVYSNLCLQSFFFSINFTIFLLSD